MWGGVLWYVLPSPEFSMPLCCSFFRACPHKNEGKKLNATIHPKSGGSKIKSANNPFCPPKPISTDLTVAFHEKLAYGCPDRYFDVVQEAQRACLILSLDKVYDPNNLCRKCYSPKAGMQFFAYMLTIELFCLQLCLGGFSPTVGFFAYNWSFCVSNSSFLLTVGICVSGHLNGL